MKYIFSPSADKFFASIKDTLFQGHLTQEQVDGINIILKTFDGYDLRYVAYALATVFHETAKTMQPIEEYGKGKGHAYGRKVRMNGKPYTTPDHIFYGKGFTQNTWIDNAETATAAAKSKGYNWDFVNHPELYLQNEPSAWVTKWSMLNGAYTGKKLSDYFNDEKTDPVNARKIINGLDAADRIAGYYHNFYNGLIK